MVIAIYGKSIEVKYKGEIETLFQQLSKHHAEVIIYAPFRDYLISELGFEPYVKAVFRSPGEVKYLANFMLSLGGDGTFLDSVTFIEESNIPVLGINFGRLGFLANISTKDIGDAISLLFTNKFIVEPRSLLQLQTTNNPFNNFPYALNDFTIQKKGTTMVTVNTYINDEFLCTYWADGLIVSTPTGSTAYSLSVGGPVISPAMQSFVISPIAPHHLTVRPLVIPDTCNIKLEAVGRSGEILVSMDSRSFAIPSPITFEIKKSSFHIGLVYLKGTNFFTTLRNKLLWGVDIRN